MISVIIPARNAAATIGVTLTSLVADKALIGEILLIDDGSEDETVARAWDASRAHELPLKVTSVRAGSAGAARNVGLSQVSCDRLFFIDADDELIPGSLGRLEQELRRNPSAGLAIGAFVRRTQTRPDVIKLPSRYGGDPQANARNYLQNRISSIAVGSALLDFSAVGDIRFATRLVLDEDTCYWAAVLTRVDVVTIDDTVLVYHVNEDRMIDRFAMESRERLLLVALEFKKLLSFGIDRATIQWRKAWLGQRMARMLIRRGRYREAARMMRVVRAHGAFRWSVRSMRYSVAIAAGRGKTN